MPCLQLVADESLAGKTVKDILRERFSVSLSFLSKLKREERGILLNGHPVNVTAVVCTGDLLSFSIADESPEQPLTPTPHPLSIVYEDDWLLVINKCAALPTIPSSLSKEEPSVAGALAAKYGPDFRFHAVSRLDRGTTGLLLTAKYGYIHEQLQRCGKDGLRREYLGIAAGTVTPPTGRIDLPIARAEGSLIRRTISENGAEAHTEYETLCNSNGFTLLRLRPLTGRTHQLRLHLSAIGYPLAGDFLYGTEDPALIFRPALHSHELRFIHPITGEALHFVSDLPADMARILK